jgi:hypothetical protein
VWAAFGVLVLLSVGPLGRFVDTSAAWLGYPYPRPGSEGLILYESLLVKRGGDIYSAITPERFISGPYPPVYYELAAWALPSRLPELAVPGNVDSIFRPGRSISLLATLVAAGLVGLLVVFEGGYAWISGRAVGPAALGGAMGGALLLTTPPVLVWATRFRGDMVMIALTAAGLVCIAAGAGGRARVRPLSPLLLSGAALFALAFFTKQTALAGPAASAAYLLARDWRAGLKWCAAMLLALAVPFALLDLATGHWFYLKMVVYHSLPFSGLTFTRLLHYAFWDEEWPLVLVAGGYSILDFGFWILDLRRNRFQNPKLISFFVLASLATLPTGAVVGADHNHLLVPGLAICAGAGAALARVLAIAIPTAPPASRQKAVGCLPSAGSWASPNSGLLPTSRGALPLLAGLPVILGLMGYVVYTSEPAAVAYGPDLARPSPPEQEQLRKIALYVRQNEGKLYYSDDTGILALAGKETPYDDAFTMSTLALQGRWDETELRAMLRQGKFSLLILSCDVNATLEQQDARNRGQQIEVAKPCRADTFTPGVLEAIRDGYKLQFRDVLFTYAPK